MPSKRRDTRTEAARKGGSVGAIKLRLPKATLAQLEQLASARGVKRVTVLCDLIETAARVSVG